MEGTVTRYNTEGNFGFITSTDGNLFQMISTSTSETLSEGDKVTFDKDPIGKGPTGLRAINVKKI